LAQINQQRQPSSISDQSGQRIGLLGGSFDPIHIAHIQLACAARDYLDLDSVTMIPASQPWQRDELKVNGQQRLEMVKLAIADEPKLFINPLEIERGGPTYTIDTIHLLDPKPNYFWLLGADQLNNFCTWHKWGDIAERLTLVVAQRPKSPLRIPSPLQDRINQGRATLEVLPFEPLTVSSRDIRQRLASNQSVDSLLDDQVIQYIKAHHLYRANSEK
jgi:nicotinate-nucleotide adenylyltransferase